MLKEPKSLINERLKTLYTDFKEVSSTSYYKVYHAKSRSEGEFHSIRIFDSYSALARESYTTAVTLFFQEILHFCQLPGGSPSIIPELFEFQENQIHFVSRLYHPLLKSTFGSDDVQYYVSKVLKDLSLEMKYLTDRLSFEKLILDPTNVFLLEDTDTFFVGDWAKNLNLNANLKNTSDQSTIIKKIDDNELSEAIYSLGCLALLVCGVVQEDIDHLKGQSRFYKVALDSIMADVNVSEVTNKLLRSMLVKDPGQRITFKGLLQALGIDGKEEMKKVTRFRINFLSLGFSYDIEMNAEDSFEKIVKLAEEKLSAKTEQIVFKVGRNGENLKVIKKKGQYHCAQEVYLAGLGTGWRDGDPAEIVVQKN